MPKQEKLQQLWNRKVKLKKKARYVNTMERAE
jgi:hypothetical protein